MLGEFKANNWNDVDGTPTGGTVKGVGLDIKWQEGALGRDDDRKEPNGAFVETVITACAQRLEYFQDSKFKCDSNAVAIQHLQAALIALDGRTKDRESRDVEGTHKV